MIKIGKKSKSRDQKKQSTSDKCSLRSNEKQRENMSGSEKVIRVKESSGD